MRVLSGSIPILGAAALAVVAACSQAPAQVISGTALRSSFPQAIDKAVVVDAKGTIISEASLASNGAFSLNVPAAKGLRLQFITASGTPALVFPRKAGAIDSRFDVKSASAAFDLGTVRYVGDPSAQQYAYRSQALTAEPADTTADTDNVECEDGVDAVTGAVCVDDDDDEGATCEVDDGADCEDGIDAVTGAECDGGPGASQDDGEADDDAETSDAAEVDGVDCEDGIDAATGAECDGGPGANQNDGEADDDAETADDAPTEAAVADHNLPASIGCDGEQDDGEHNDGETADD